MAEPTQQDPSLMDRLGASVPGAALRAVAPGMGLVELLREVYRRQNPNAAAPAAPARPAPTESGAAPQQGPARTAPRAPTVTPGAASTPAPAPEGGGEARPSLLDTLRESVQQDATPENTAADRLASFAAGMTSGNDRRRGFFGDLLAGVQAQQQSDASHRAEMLRSIQAQAGLAEMERKGILEKAKEASQAREREQHGRYYEAMANLRDRMPGTGTGTSTRGQLTERDLLNLEPSIRARVAAEVRGRYANQLRPPSAEQQQQEINAETSRLMAEALRRAQLGRGASVEELMGGAAPQPGMQPPQQNVRRLTGILD